MVKCLPAVREARVQSLGWEDPLEKEMATHSSNLAWKIPWTEEPGGLQSMGVAKSRTRLSDWTEPNRTERGWGQGKRVSEDEMAGWHHWLNMNLDKLREMVRDREAWWAAVHGVAKRWAQLSDWTTTTNAQVFKFLYIFPTPLFLFVFLYNSHPNGCKVAIHTILKSASSY